MTAAAAPRQARPESRWRGLASLAATLALLAPAVAAGGARPRYGGQLSVLLPAAPAELDPARATTPSDLALARALHATLVDADAAGTVRAGLLATPPEPDPAGRAYRLRVAPGLRFQDGNPVTAGDVATSLARLAAPGAPHGWLVAAVEGAAAVGEGRARSLAGVEVLSELELRVALAYPLPDLPLALAAAPAAIVRASAGEPPVGAGPFRLAARQADGVRLAAWDGSAGGRPFLDGVALRGGDRRAAARALSAGGADVALRPEAVARTARDGPPLGVVVAVVSRRLGAGAAPIRAALAAVDRAELARRFRAPAIPLEALLPPPLLPARDRRAAATAGGLPPRLALLLPAGGDAPRAAADRLQVKLHDRGVRAAVEVVPAAVFAARLAAGDFDVALAPLWLAAPTSPALALAQVAWTLGGPRRGSDALRRAAAAAPGDLPRVAAELEDELLAVPLYAARLRLAARAGVEGLALGADGTPDLADTWLAPGAAP